MSDLELGTPAVSEAQPASEEPAPGRPGRIQWMLILLAVVAGITATVVLTTGDDAGSDAPRPTVSLAADSLELSEGTRVVIRATLSEPAGRNVNVQLEIGGTASETDFRLSRLRIQIPSGSTTGSVTGRVFADEEAEGPETIVISIIAASNAEIGRLSSVNLQISDGSSQTGDPAGPDDPELPPATPGASTPETGPTTGTTAPTGSDSTPTTADPGPLGDASNPVGGLAEVVVVASGSISSARSATITYEAATDRLVLLLLANTGSTGTSPLADVSGDPGSWDLVDTTTRNGGPRRIAVLRTVGSGGQARATVSYASDQNSISWMVLEIGGVPLDDNGGAAIVQSAVAAAEGNETRAVVELEQPLSSADATTIGAILTGAPDAEGAPGFTTIGAAGNRPTLISIAGAAGTVQTSDWTGRAHWIGIALELSS